LIIILIVINGCERNFSPFEPNFPYDNALVYNKVDEQGRWQIFLNNIRGTKPQNISNNPYNDAYDPIWSPTGEYIAFRWDKDIGGADVYLFDINGDSLINITKDLAMNESVYPEMWTPDGKKLLYHYHKMGEPFYYYIMNSDGTEKQKLFETGSGFIAFCDQGNSILYNQNQSLYKKNIRNNSTELILNLKDISVYSTWVDDYDPVSNTILCHEDSSSWGAGATFLIKKINLNSMQIDTLVVSEKGITLLRPVFSNDYQKVAYIERDYINHISKIILLEDGKRTELNRLTKENESYGWYKIEFSPHDSYITYTVLEDIPGDWVRFNRYVYVLHIATQKTFFIDQAVAPHWNPLINF